MSDPQLVHLHVHSDRSALDGVSSPEALAAEAAAHGMTALALTDHGHLAGAVDFAKACKAHGVRPIFGMEAYVADDHRARRGKEDQSPAHLTLLVKDEQGWRNLIRLATIAGTDGMYYGKPRIDRDLLARYHGGLICLSGCIGGVLAEAALQGEEAALAVASWHKDVFGEDYWIELQHHDIPEVQAWLRQAPIVARKLGLPMVATNDVHYARPDGYYTQDLLLCLNTNTTVLDQTRKLTALATVYLRSADEMAVRFAGLPEALSNSLAIAERCTFSLKLGQVQLPAFPVPPGETALSYLAQLVRQGLRNRYGRISPAHHARLEYELGVIRQTGFAPYFLIAWDLIAHARRSGIRFNLRGSGAGSLVCHGLGISEVNPLRYGLVFERFLNPERIAMPDLDLDFQDDRRGEMVTYARDRYGEDHVAQIVAYQTMGAKAAIRDATRVLGLPYGLGSELSTLVDGESTLAKQIETNAGLAERAKADDKAGKVLDGAERLEGIVRGFSTHAAGIVIAPQPLIELCPLIQIKDSTTKDAVKTVTQWDMGGVEAAGLLKLDFLGLINLQMVDLTVRSLAARGIVVDPDRLPEDDEITYELLAAGYTIGVFQMEGVGITKLVRDIRPRSIDDLALIAAIYRPGPLEHIPQYLAVRQGREEFRPPDERIADIVRPTGGVIVFQEQVIEICRRVAGYSRGRADIVRKAVGKKDEKLLAEQEAGFIAGARANGYTEAGAKAIWAYFLPFARYGFNKCLTAETLVTDADTGQRIPLIDVVNGKHPNLTILSFNERSLKVVRAKVQAAFSSGDAVVYRIRTRSGRWIQASWNHPIYTPAGWVLAEQLSAGQYVALARRLPCTSTASLEPHELTVLGYALAEGNLCHPHGFYVYTKSVFEMQDYVAALEQFENTQASVGRHRGCFSIYSKRSERKKPNGAFEYLKQLGLLGKTATEKALPPIVFSLPSDQIAHLVGRLWVGDGTARSGGIGYATSSKQLAEGVQQLLLRLGFVSTLRTCYYPYRGQFRVGYSVDISGGPDTIARFIQIIGPHLVGNRRMDVTKLVLKRWQNKRRSTNDIVPLAVLPAIREAVRQTTTRNGKSESALLRAAGLSANALKPSGRRRRGLAVTTVQKAASIFGAEELTRLAEAEVYWDEVTEVEKIGTLPVYDLTVEGTHTFLANDFVVHNSHAVSYGRLAYITAYLKANYPAEFMAAYLTAYSGKTEKIQRGIAEARRLRIPVLPPDVLRSNVEFTIEDGAIRCGLGAIKGLGEAAHTLVGARPYEDLADFIRRAGLNEAQLDTLARIGALPWGNRRQALHQIPGLLKSSRQEKRGQLSLFSSGELLEVIELPSLPDLSWQDRLDAEAKALGVTFTPSPVDQIAAQLGTVPIAGLVEGPAEVVGLLTNVRTFTTKTGDLMAVGQVEDNTGTMRFVIFPRAYRQIGEVPEGKVVLLGGTVKHDEGEERTELIVDRLEVQAAPEAARQLAPAEPPRYVIRIEQSDPDGFGTLKALMALILANAGGDVIAVEIGAKGGHVCEHYRINLIPAVERELVRLCGTRLRSLCRAG